MQPDAQRHLSIPEGTEGFSLGDAYVHRKVVRLAEDLFASWGYLPAQLPVFDFFDSYRTLLDDTDLRSIYRLMDRNGDLLMLRSDMTLFLAKHLGAHAGAASGPVRVSYGDSILRHQESEGISHGEYFQLGAELIGVPGLRGDVEIAALVGELCLRLGLPTPVLHIGSRALFNAMTRKLPEETRVAVAAMVAHREWDAFATETGIDPSPFTFIGTPAELRARRAALLSSADGDAEQAVSELELLARTLESVDHPFDMRIDLSEIGARSYYTGCVFAVYLEGVATAVASGGRYDDLLVHFGDRRPAVGFSLMLRKVMDRLEDWKAFAAPEPRRVDEDDLARALEQASAIRAEGGIATL